MVRLIALDIDGTLLPDGGREIPAANREAVAAARAAGIHVTLATARKYSGPRRFARMLGLPGDLPLICHGGAYIATADGAVIAHAPLDIELAREMADFIDARGERLLMTIDDRNYLARRYDEATDAGYVDITVTPTCRDAVFAPPTRIAALDPPTCAALYDRFAGDPRAVLSRFVHGGVLTCVTAFHPAVSKGTAVRDVCAHLGIDPRDAVAMGDQETDLAMFEVVGLSVAMPHAPAHVRAGATVTAPGEPAVAWAIEAILDGRLGVPAAHGDEQYA